MLDYRYKRLRNFILLSMILTPAVIYILTLGVGYFYFSDSIQNKTISTIKRIVGDHRQMIESFLTEREGDLSFILDTYTYQELSDPEILQTAIKKLQKRSNAFADLGIFNQFGVHINYHGPYDLSNENYQNEAWYREVMEKGHYISNVFKGFRNVPHFVIAIVKQEKKQKWVIRATIDTYFFNTLVEKVSIGQTGEAYILNRKGILQTRKRSGGELMEAVDGALNSLSLHEGIQVFEQNNPNEEKYLVATTWLKDRSWMLVVRQTKTDAFQALSRATYIIILMITFGILIIVLLSVFLSAKIIHRMETIDSEKESLNFQLIRASGLAELGEMATGFAHEINNPLQIIKNEQKLIQLNLIDLKEKETIDDQEITIEIDDSLDQIGIQVDRCAKITQAILKFGRMSEPENKKIDLTKLIPEIMAVVEKKADINGIQLSQRIAPNLKSITGDPAQLQQIVLNLINNAMYAVTEHHGSSGGKIELSVSKGKTDDIEVVVKDNGVGISSENQAKVFSPFFTTKPVGKGTGLGLSVCYGIVKKMGGQLQVESQLGNGSIFKVCFPLNHN